MSRHDLFSGDIEARAHRRVRRKLGFYIHAFVFVLVNVVLYAGHELNGGRGPVLLWGWGVGLLIHGLVTFASLRGDGLRERMLRREIERMKRERQDDDRA